MGSTHKAHLITSGGGLGLHEVEKKRYRHDLNDFLLAQGASEHVRGAALAHFDIGYDDGYSGEVPYYNEEWDRGV